MQDLQMRAMRCAMTWLRRQICRAIGHRWRVSNDDSLFGLWRLCCRCNQSECLKRGVLSAAFTDMAIVQLQSSKTMAKLCGTKR